MPEINVPTDNTKKIDLVLNNFQESYGWLQSSGYLQEWRDWNDLYRSIPDGKPYDWMSNKFIPLINSKVETAYSNLQSLLFAANPFFQVRPRDPKNEPNAKNIQKLLMYQFEEANTVYEFMQFLKSVCIFGTGIGMVSWDRKFDHRTILKDKYEPLKLFGMQFGSRYVGQEPVNEKYLSFDGPTMINMNIGDCFPDPTSIEIQDGWMVVRSYKSLDYLKNMNTYYPDTYNAEVLKINESDNTNVKKAANDIQANNARLNDQRTTKPKKEIPNKPTESDLSRIELLTRWGMDYDVDGVLKQRVLTVAAGKYLIRNTNTPFWHGKIPFFKSTYIPVVNEFYGIGIPELCEDLQTSINETVNQKNDNISLALNRTMIYSKDAGIDIKKLKSEPGNRIGVDGYEIDKVIKFLDAPISTRDATMFTAECERWLQEVSAVTKLTMGLQGTDTNDTATGMSILQRASGDRFMSIARTIEQTGFKEMLRMFYQLDYQYITVEKMVRIVGESGNTWIAIPPEDVRRDYDLMPAGIFTLENKAQQALKLIQFKQITKDDPTIRQSELNKKIYSALQIGDNPNEIMFDDAQMQDIMKVAQGMALQMVQKMMGGGQTQLPGKPKTGQPINSGQATKGSTVGSAQVPPPTPAGAGQSPQL